MEFYVSYSVQADNLGGVPVNDETLAIYDTEKQFLLELHDYCLRVKESFDGDSTMEDKLEDVDNYMAKLDEKLSDPSVQNGLYDEELHSSADKLISTVLNHIASRLGLDHDRVLGSRYSIPLMIGLLHQQGGHHKDSSEWDKLLYWYIHTFLWGRYSGSTESILAQASFPAKHG